MNHPLFDLGPRLALTLDEQRKHPDLAAYPNAGRVQRLVISKKANRLSSASSKASLAADFAGRNPFIGQPFGMIHCFDC